MWGSGWLLIVRMTLVWTPLSGCHILVSEGRGGEGSWDSVFTSCPGSGSLGAGMEFEPTWVLARHVYM